MDALLTIGGMALVICIAIASITYVNIALMRSGRFALRRDPGTNPQPEPSSLTPLQPFLTGNGFKYDGHYRFGSIRLVNWQQDPVNKISRTFSIAVDSQGKTSLDLTSRFNDEVSLTTVNQPIAFALPRPKGDFIQSIPCESVIQLWQAHLDGERHIITRFNPVIRPAHRDFVEIVNSSTRRQAEYVSSHTLYPIRAIFWYFVTRHRMAGKSIRDQFP